MMIVVLFRWIFSHFPFRWGGKQLEHCVQIFSTVRSRTSTVQSNWLGYHLNFYTAIVQYVLWSVLIVPKCDVIVFSHPRQIPHYIMGQYHTVLIHIFMTHNILSNI